MGELWVAIVSGAFTLAGVCVTAYVTIRKANSDLKRTVDKLVEHDHEQYLGILRLTVMSEGMPISERIIAGDKYVKEGGNGEVKQYYHNLLEEHTK